jgi:hypothetical protein
VASSLHSQARKSNIAGNGGTEGAIVGISSAPVLHE